MTRSSSAGSRSWRPRSWATAVRHSRRPSRSRSLALTQDSCAGCSRPCAAAAVTLPAAMKPYLAEKRRRKIDRAMKLARLASLAELAAGEMGEDDDV